MLVKLSSRGQLVIPKEFRDSLMLSPGTELDLKLIDGQLIIRPRKDKGRAKAAIDKLYGIFANSDLLSDLEAEHKNEIKKDCQREQRLRT